MDWKSDFYLKFCLGNDMKKVESFIENLLEQERKRMSDEIEKKAKIFDIAVSNVKVSSVKLVKLSDALAIINK